MQLSITAVDKLELSSIVALISIRAAATLLTESINLSMNPVNSSGLFSPVFGLFPVSVSELYTPISFSSCSDKRGSKISDFLTFFLAPSMMISTSSLSPFDV
jgi:hypothetical protein